MGFYYSALQSSFLGIGWTSFMRTLSEPLRRAVPGRQIFSAVRLAGMGLHLLRAVKRKPGKSGAVNIG